MKDLQAFNYSTKSHTNLRTCDNPETAELRFTQAQQNVSNILSSTSTLNVTNNHLKPCASVVKDTQTSNHSTKTLPNLRTCDYPETAELKFKQAPQNVSNTF